MTSEPGEQEAPASKREMISIRDVFHDYGGPTVLDAANGTVYEGDSLCVIGPNGGGKSTLLKLILGLLEPTRGRLRVLGQAPRLACSRVGYVPQSIRFDPLFPISVLEIVLMGQLHRLRVGRYPKECTEIARNALQKVGLADFERRSFSDLSGGERQRTLIARALASEPEILLLDEPTANVDLTVERKFLDTLAEIKKSITVIMVTHDLDVVSELGDFVWCVNRRMHRHNLPLAAETIAEIFSGSHRVIHDRNARHQLGDHSRCTHD